MQTWSLSHLQKLLLNTIKNPFPIGFIYVQLPNEKSPTEIWPWMMWNDVSSAYAGVFFRVTGGEAATFGQVQEDNSPRLSEVNGLLEDQKAQHSQSNWWNNTIPREGWSNWVITGWTGQVNFIRFQMSGGEVRPRNMAIRVWKRTG
jgi:hypothetical protein